MTFKKSQLVKIAEELNNALGLDPVIETKKVKNTYLEEKIKEAGDLVNPTEDEFSDETWNVLKELGVFGTEKEKPVEQENEEEDKTLVEQDETETEEEKAVDIVQMVESTKKLAELKQIVEDYNDFEGLRESLDKCTGLKGTKDLKAAMLKEIDENENENEEKTQEPENAEQSAKSESQPKEEEKKTSSKKKGTGAERRIFMETMIEKGKYTKKEIVDKTLEQFPDITRSTSITEITDGKNPKYNKFSALLHMDENKIVSFREK